MPIVTQPLTSLDLPRPLTNGTGWCWAETSSLLPQPANFAGLPRISIVVPSYNQGHYLEETVRSILLQGYPNLELVIMDGGSTDDTLAVIQHYAPYIGIWVSEPDRGQSHAVNKGIQQATGELIGWQNSDDIYQPGALWQAATAAIAQPETDIFFGNVTAIDSAGQNLISYPVREFDPHDLLPFPTNLFNQCMVMRRRVFEQIGLIDESYRHCMDYDLFWRMVMAGCRFQFVPGMAACFRHHPQSKGSTQHDIADQEFWQLYKRVYSCPEFPPSLRTKALQCLRSACLRDIAKGQRSLFRQRVAELSTIAGWRGLTPRLAAKYIAAGLGF